MNRLTWTFAAALALAAPSLFAQGASFKRGDANASDTADLSDAVFTLNFLFGGGPSPSCLDAADMNDDGKLDISDAVSLLGFLFLGASPPPPPYPDCGPDPTADAVTCAEYSHCSSCFGQTDLDAAVAAKIDPIVCIPGGSVDPLAVGTLNATVCPLALSKPCPLPSSTALGCPVQFTQVQGALDVLQMTVTLHIQGKVDGLPVRIEDTIFGGVTDCHINIVFDGDVILPFSTEPAGGLMLRITDILEPSLDNANVTLSTADTNLLCKAVVALQDQFVDAVIAQLQAASAQLIAGLKEELVGKTLCPVAP